MSSENKTLATEVGISLESEVDDNTASEIEFTCSSIALPQEFRPSGVGSSETGCPSKNEGSSKAELDALIKIAVIESKTEMIVNYAQETKSLEIEVNKLINHIYKKNPDLKNELLMIKKLVTDHSKVVKILSASKVEAA